MTSKPFATLVVATVCSVTLLGCDDGSATPSESPTGSTQSTSIGASSSSPSPTRPPTQAEREAQAAGQTVVKYWAVIDALAADPSQSLAPLDTVARDQARAQRLVALRTYLAKGLVQKGNAVVTDVSAKKSKSRTYSVSACVDVSDVDFVDKNGASQVNPGRPDKQRFTYTVATIDGQSFVTVDTLKGKPC